MIAKVKAWALIGLRVGLIVALLLGGAEIVLRFWGYGSLVTYRPDPDLLWLPDPNQNGKTVVGRKPITINGAGFRYPVEVGKEKAHPDELRVFAFGDSVTMGWGVDDDSHYSAVLERMLTEDFPDDGAQVVSAGVNAYPLSLCSRRFVKMLDDGYEIDVAIVAYSFNLIFEPVTALTGEERERFLRKVALKRLVRRSALYNFVVEDILRSALYYRVRDRLVKGSWEVKETKSGSKSIGAFKTFKDALVRAKENADEHDVRLVFLLLGSSTQRNELNFHQRYYLEFAEREGIPLVNMVDHLRDVDHEGLFMDHVHPTEQGHEIIARELLSVLRGLMSGSGEVPQPDHGPGDAAAERSGVDARS